MHIRKYKLTEVGNIITQRRQKRTLESSNGAHKSKKKNNIGNNIYLGTLNVRTLRTSEREIELDNVLMELNFSILDLGEIRRIGENIIEK